MKKYLIPATALILVTGSAYAENLESPLFIPNQEQVFSKTDFNIPETDGVDFSIGEEFGYGFTNNLYGSLLLGWTQGDGDMGLSDLATKVGYRINNNGFAFDLEGKAGMDISRDTSVIAPYSYGEDDGFVGFNGRIGKSINDWTFAIQAGYDIYVDESDFNTFNFSVDAQYRFTPKFSANFGLFRHDNDIIEQSIVRAQLNFQASHATLLSAYVSHDAEAEQDDNAFGFKVGVGF